MRDNSVVIATTAGLFAEINAGIKTINDVLRERGKEPKPWGDVWHRPKSLAPNSE